MLPHSEAPWCPLCDMPRWLCTHRQRGDQPPMPEGLDRPEPPALRLVPWRSYFDGDDYRAGWSHDPDGEDGGIVACDDSHETGDSWLCGNCKKLVTKILGDLPALIYDLHLHLTRQTAFVQRGTKLLAGDDDESPLPYDEAAGESLTALARLLGTTADLAQMAVRARWLAGTGAHLRNPAVADWSRRLSLVVRRAHRVIERPEPLVFYGPCPEGHDLWAGRDAATVDCGCGYVATMDDHRKAALDAGEDRWLTVGELVGAITRAKEPVTRDQINSWIRREGLVRETHTRPVWRNGQLLARPAYVYRLGDVRALAARADTRRRASDPDAA